MQNKREYCKIFQTINFGRERRKKFLKTGRLFAFTGRRGEVNQNRDITSLDGERQQVCRIGGCDGFNPN